MSLAPDFDIGWWNVWIPLIVFYAASFGPFMIRGETAEARMAGEPSWRETGRRARAATVVTHGVLMPLSLVYGLFVPLEQGTWWMYVGLFACVVATAAAFAASVSFVRAPLGAPMTHGVYAISRHPMYASAVVIFLGVGLAATSWVFLVASVVEWAAWTSAIPEEERTMIAKYGAAYEEYMRATPRWLGFPRRPSGSLVTS